jgi:glycoside/pentoside/hexuronide:cation symporter, GPH family
MHPHNSGAPRVAIARERLSIREKIGYGLGDTATNLVWRTLMVFLPIFYTDVFGISAGAVGTLLLVCRYWDGITDFVMGLVADRTNSRWGKFRPWILWTALPFGIMTVLTFTTFDLSYTGKLIYAYITYSGLIVVFTANNVPYSALTGVLTADPVERTALSSYRFFFAFLGGLITQGLNITLVSYFGQGNDVRGYTYTMTLFAALSAVLFIITFLTTTERVTPPPEQRTPLKQDFTDLMKNKPWIVLFFMGILFVTFTTLKQGVTMFYFKYFVGDVGLAAAFMIAGLAAAMAGAALTRRFTLLFGKRGTVQYCFLLALVTSGLLYFAGPEDTGMIFILGSLTEFSTGPIVTLFFAMLADAADYSEWKNGRRATALVFSAGTLSMKFGTGIAGAITGWLLTMFGYAANAAQSVESLEGIRLLISVIPAIAAILAIGVFRFYGIDDRLVERMHQELSARKKGEA